MLGRKAKYTAYGFIVFGLTLIIMAMGLLVVSFEAKSTGKTKNTEKQFAVTSHYSAIDCGSHNGAKKLNTKEPETELPSSDCLKEPDAPKLLGYAEIPNSAGGDGRNAALAASLINGKVIQPGEEFSFNRAVGRRTVSRGFVEGTTIVKTVYGPEMVPDIGGGVCRTATVLHLAVLNAGLEVVERHSHSIPVSYAEPGKDAAVAWPYWDFRFRNTTEKVVAIKAHSSQGRLRVELWAIH